MKSGGEEGENWCLDTHFSCLRACCCSIDSTVTVKYCIQTPSCGRRNTARDPKILGDEINQAPQRTGDPDTLSQRGSGYRPDPLYSRGAKYTTLTLLHWTPKITGGVSPAFAYHGETRCPSSHGYGPITLTWPPIQPRVKYITEETPSLIFGGRVRSRFLQRVSIACYAERCISYDRFCLTDRPTVCLSQSGIMPKRLQLRSCGLHWRIAPWF